MFSGQYINLDFAMAAVMLTLLILAAIFDANGAEVPDALTVPYAFTGISVSVLHERWGAALVATMMVIVVLSGWSPKWLQRLNDMLMARAYKSEEAIQEETGKLADKAARFAKRERQLMTSALGMVTAFFLFGAVIGVMSLTETSARIRYILSVTLWLISFFLLTKRSERAAKDGELEEAEPLTAFGGADVLVFAGILGFYGGVAFFYVMAATMVGVLILVAAVTVVNGKRSTVGVPLMPGILVMAPVRLFILVTICPRVIQTFEWAMGNINIGLT